MGSSFRMSCNIRERGTSYCLIYLRFFFSNSVLSMVKYFLLQKTSLCLKYRGTFLTFSVSVETPH